MPLITDNGLEYYQFNIFKNYEIVHGIFTRKGGVSSGPYTSLNLGGTNGDLRSNVIENRKRIFDVMGRNVSSIFDVWQVHGAEILVPNQPRALNEPHLRADGVVTNKQEITILMRFADCVPILLYDPRNHVAGMVHAGWQGTVKKIAAAAVDRMVKEYGSNPVDIIAGIGPSIGPDHYEVQKDVLDRFSAVFGSSAEEMSIHKQGKIWLDLWQANRIILNGAGIEKVETSNECTACNINRWYSHRGEKGMTGRFGAVLGLK